MKRPRIYELFQDFRVFDLHLTVNLLDIMYVHRKTTTLASCPTPPSPLGLLV
jgi:hypothetical protein